MIPDRPLIVAGLGCRRDCPADELHDLLLRGLAEQGLQPADLAALASSANKAAEAGLRELGERLALPVAYLSVEMLAPYEARLSQVSDLVQQVSGSGGVAEACALAHAEALSGEAARLLMNKRKSARATVAIAISAG